MTSMRLRGTKLQQKGEKKYLEYRPQTPGIALIFMDYIIIPNMFKNPKSGILERRQPNLCLVLFFVHGCVCSDDLQTTRRDA